MDITIRSANMYDLSAIASIHKRTFSDHYLGNFSEGLIAKFYKEYFIREVTFLVACREDRIIGFVMGGFSPELNASAASFEKKYLFNNMIEVILRPNVWISTLKRVMAKVNNRRKPTTPSDNPQKKRASFRLLSISILPEEKGSGVARMLVEEFEQIALQNAPSYGLSVHENNLRAIGFYKKMGLKADNSLNGSLFMSKQL